MNRMSRLISIKAVSMACLFTRIVLIASEAGAKGGVHLTLILCKQEKMVSTSFKVESPEDKEFEMVLL